MGGADHGYGDRRRVAAAVRQPADVGLRITPATCPLDTACAAPFDVRRWRRAPGLPHRAWQGWGRWAPRRDQVRRLAAQCPPEAAAVARRRTRRQAPQPGRTPTAATRLLAAWLRVITTRPAADWPLVDVLRLMGSGPGALVPPVAATGPPG